MNNLSEQVCEVCCEGAPHLTNEEIQFLLPGIPGWQVLNVDGVRQLEKVFTFSNFVDALAFTNKLAQLAEDQGHHPAILLEWGSVGVRWWTHKISGVHRNDVIMAAKTDSMGERED